MQPKSTPVLVSFASVISLFHHQIRSGVRRSARLWSRTDVGGWAIRSPWIAVGGAMLSVGKHMLLRLLDGSNHAAPASTAPRRFAFRRVKAAGPGSAIIRPFRESISSDREGARRGYHGRPGLR
jgi:hypothetical protein